MVEHTGKYGDVSEAKSPVAIAVQFGIIFRLERRRDLVVRRTPISTTHFIHTLCEGAVDTFSWSSGDMIK